MTAAPSARPPGDGGPGEARRLVRRLGGLFTILFGTLCLLYPFAELFLEGGPELWRDTRAFLGAGTNEGAPEVAEVGCARHEHGTGRLPRLIYSWDCRLVLTGDGPPAVLERELPEDLSGRLPVLRRLSGPDEPPVFGVVWGADELTGRWLRWGWTSALSWGFGVACLLAGRLDPRGKRPPQFR